MAIEFWQVVYVTFLGAPSFVLRYVCDPLYRKHNRLIAEVLLTEFILSHPVKYLENNSQEMFG